MELDEDTGAPLRATGRKHGKSRNTRFETTSSLLFGVTALTSSSSSSSGEEESGGSEEEPDAKAAVAEGPVVHSSGVDPAATARLLQPPDASSKLAAHQHRASRKKSLLKRPGRPANQQLTEAEEFRIVRDRCAELPLYLCYTELRNSVMPRR